MKKTVFEGIVNGTKYDNVNDYNNAVQAALNANENVQASSHTEIVDVPDSDQCECQCECKDNQKEVDQKEVELKNFINDKLNILNVDTDELSKSLNEFVSQFDEMSDDLKTYASSLVGDIKKKLLERMSATESELDATDVKASAIKEHIDKLDEEIDKLDDEYIKLIEKADDLEAEYDKMSMIIDSINEILAKPQKKNEPKKSGVLDLWKAIFGE